jgi:hypothetical protein
LKSYTITLNCKAESLLTCNNNQIESKIGPDRDPCKRARTDTKYHNNIVMG